MDRNIKFAREYNIKLGYLTHIFEIPALSVVRTLFYILLKNTHMKYDFMFVHHSGVTAV